jgi:hypothetical protein
LIATRNPDRPPTKEEPASALTEVWSVDVMSLGGDRVFLDADTPRTYWLSRRCDYRIEMERWHKLFQVQSPRSSGKGRRT